MFLPCRSPLLGFRLAFRTQPQTPNPKPLTKAPLNCISPETQNPLYLQPPHPKSLLIPRPQNSQSQNLPKPRAQTPAPKPLNAIHPFVLLWNSFNPFRKEPPNPQRPKAAYASPRSFNSHRFTKNPKHPTQTLNPETANPYVNL